VFALPDRTPYDWNWRLFDIPVRVHPYFWLVTVLMGLNALEEGLGYLLLWVVCVFVSLMVHELGHVLAGRFFGSRGQILLYGFGGLAIGSTALARRWQRVVVCAAGPLAGFVLFGLAWLADRFLHSEETSPLMMAAIHDLFWINLFWGVLNLLPIWPLDGGQISAEVCEVLMPRKGIQVALIVSMVTAGLLIINVLITTSTHHSPIPYLDGLRGAWPILLFALLAYNNYLTYQAESNNRRLW
jgi:Zn-dependent protease